MSFWSHLEKFAAQINPPDGIITQDLSNDTMRNVFNVVLGLAGAVAVAYVKFGGLKYTLSQGDSNKIKQAKDAILYALIGIVVVAVAFILVNYVIGKF